MPDWNWFCGVLAIPGGVLGRQVSLATGSKCKQFAADWHKPDSFYPADSMSCDVVPSCLSGLIFSEVSPARASKYDSNNLIHCYDINFQVSACKKLTTKHCLTELFAEKLSPVRQGLHLVDIYTTVARMAVINLGQAGTDVQLRSCRHTSAVRPSVRAARSQRRQAAVRVCASAPSQGTCRLMRAVTCKFPVKHNCTGLY